MTGGLMIEMHRDLDTLYDTDGNATEIIAGSTTWTMEADEFTLRERLEIIWSLLRRNRIRVVKTLGEVNFT